MRGPSTPIFDLFHQGFRGNQAHNFVYLNNPKVACSAIKMVFWTHIAGHTPQDLEDIHDLRGSPFERDIREMDWVREALIFSFVRNPYTRVVSAYLDKIANRAEPTWKWFVKRYGVGKEADVPFDVFVDLISQDDPAELDPHWRPQYLNICYPLIESNFIGHLETMDRQLPGILTRALGRSPEVDAHFRPHRTDARDKYRQLLRNPLTLERVETLYARDFEYFHYARDVSHDYVPLHPMAERDGRHDRLADIFGYRRLWSPGKRRAFLDRFDPATPGLLGEWVQSEQAKLAHPVRRFIF